MDSQEPHSKEHEDDAPLEPLLEQAVQRIAASRPPADLTARSLAAAKGHAVAEARPTVGRGLRRSKWYVVALAVAASIVLAVLLWPRPNGNIEQPIIVDKRQPAPSQEDNGPSDSDWVNQSPTLWAYHRSASRSEDELDELLAAHAGRFRVSGPVTRLLPSGS